MTSRFLNLIGHNVTAFLFASSLSLYTMSYIINDMNKIEIKKNRNSYDNKINDLKDKNKLL